MIKETVDAVRIAEMDAEKIVSTANDNAADMKQEIKVKAVQYRNDLLQKAQEKAKKDMDIVVQECNEYNREYNKKIDSKVSELKNTALKREEKTVNDVIDALI